jgi:hypothetical protein
MNSTRDQLLPGASFSQQQDSRIGSGYHFDLLKYVPQGGTLSHNSGKTSERIDLALRIHIRVHGVIAWDNTSERKVSITIFNCCNVSEIHVSSPQRPG